MATGNNILRSKDRTKTSRLKGSGLFHEFEKWVHSKSEPERVAIAAAIGTVLAWLTYELIYYLNPFEPRATSSWTVAFIIGVFRQHHLHRTLSFPGTIRSYSGSLWRVCAMALLVLVIGTSLNYWFVQYLQFNHRAAWAGCLISVAALEYALMKIFVFIDPKTERQQ